MTDFFNFDPRTLTQSSNNESAANGNTLIYKCNPKNSISEDGHYRATIKVLFNPFDFQNSVIERQSYSITDENGWFEAVSKLTNGDKDCPIFKAWKALRYSKDPLKESWANTKLNGGKGWFNKRTERWVTIQVIEDKNQPELEGQYLLWKLPKFIQTLIDAKQSPSVESGKPSIPVMDLLIGRGIELDVKPGPDDKNDPSRRNREISYDLSSLTEDPVQCTMPDGSSLITDEQEEIVESVLKILKKAWKEKDVTKRAEIMAEFSKSEDVQKFNEFYGSEVLPKVQQFCPNVKEEMSYKPWDEEKTARVNAWLQKVTNGIDPEIPTAFASPAPTSSTTSASVETSVAAPNVTDILTPKVATTTSASSDDDDDDLPF